MYLIYLLQLITVILLNMFIEGIIYKSKKKPRDFNEENHLARIETEEEETSSSEEETEIEEDEKPKLELKKITDIASKIEARNIQVVKRHLEPTSVGIFEHIKYKKKYVSVSISTLYNYAQTSRNLNRLIILEVIPAFDKRITDYFKKNQPIRITIKMLPVNPEFLDINKKRVFLYFNKLQDLDTLNNPFQYHQLFLKDQKVSLPLPKENKIFAGFSHNFSNDTELRFIKVSTHNYQFVSLTNPIVKLETLIWFDFNYAFTYNLEPISFVCLKLFSIKNKKVQPTLYKKLIARYVEINQKKKRNVYSQQTLKTSFYSDWFISPEHDVRIVYTNLSPDFNKLSKLVNIFKDKYSKLTTRSHRFIDDRQVAYDFVSSITFKDIVAMVEEPEELPKSETQLNTAEANQFFNTVKDWEPNN